MKNMSINEANRNQVAIAAWNRNGGKMDSRPKRERTKGQSNRAAVNRSLRGE